jgi:hypothetical protein
MEWKKTIPEIDREIKAEIKKLLAGDDSAPRRIHQLSLQKEELMKPRRLRFLKGIHNG